MTKDQLKLQIPVGVRDLLPSEALRKRSLENSFEKIFRTWGYNEVITPTFEFYDALSIGRGAEEDAQLYKFIDRQGHILTLRPDMTTPIARLASSKMRDWARPMRFFYMANVFSYEDPQAGRQREFYQSGIELIGEGSPYADAEVIAIAVELLKQSGLRNFQVSIGHVDILYGMMEELGLPEDQVGRVKAAISNRNYVGLQELLDEFNVPESDKERFMRIITTHGEKDIIQEARKLARNEKTLGALDILDKVYEALEAYEITANVELNFSILRGLDYYTGIVFEGFSSYIGFPILGGGRYDNLMGQFGGTCPATGFALGLERLLLSLEREGSTPEVAAEPDYVVLYREDQAAAAFKKARELREEGYVVVTQQATGNEQDVETNRGKTTLKV